MATIYYYIKLCYKTLCCTDIRMMIKVYIAIISGRVHMIKLLTVNTFYCEQAGVRMAIINISEYLKIIKKNLWLGSPEANSCPDWCLSANDLKMNCSREVCYRVGQ